MDVHVSIGLYCDGVVLGYNMQTTSDILAIWKATKFTKYTMSVSVLISTL